MTGWADLDLKERKKKAPFYPTAAATAADSFFGGSVNKKVAVGAKLRNTSTDVGNIPLKLDLF